MLSGDTWLLADLGGRAIYYAVWGDVDAPSAFACVSALADCYRRGATRVIADFSHVARVRIETLAAIDPIVRQLAAADFGARTVLVRPRASDGIALLGFFAAYLQANEYTVTDAWDTPQTMVPLDDVRDRVADARARVLQRVGDDAVLMVVRRLFAEHGPPLRLAEAAAQLHVSPRGLERKLRAAGTGFRAERERARRFLWRTLAQQPAKVACEALGFASARELSRWRRRLG